MRSPSASRCTASAWQPRTAASASPAAATTTGRRRRHGHPTRRAHALAEVTTIGGIEELREAEAWALAHLPPEEPASLLHGDLLGQNILLHPEEPPAVIDWERAQFGDPAYDLAIVTRGVRQPFQIAHGLDRLLEAYAPCAARPVTACDVHLYELCVAGRWYRAAVEDGSGNEPPEQLLGRVRNILTRARVAEACEEHREVR